MATNFQTKIVETSRSFLQMIVADIDGAYQAMLSAKSRGTPSAGLLTNIAAEFLQSTSSVPFGGEWVPFAGGGTGPVKIAGKVMRKTELWQQITNDEQAEPVLAGVLASKVLPDKNAIAAAIALDSAFAKQADMIEFYRNVTKDEAFAKAFASLVSAVARFGKAMYIIEESLPKAKKSGTPAVSWSELVQAVNVRKEE